MNEGGRTDINYLWASHSHTHTLFSAGLLSSSPPCPIPRKYVPSPLFVLRRHAIQNSLSPPPPFSLPSFLSLNLIPVSGNSLRHGRRRRRRRRKGSVCGDWHSGRVGIPLRVVCHIQAAADPFPRTAEIVACGPLHIFPHIHPIVRNVPGRGNLW